jgi:hypothetical protein
MKAHEHYAEGQRNLAQAATAQAPDRLIGMAQAHFLAAQTALQADAYGENWGMFDADRRAWEAALNQQFGPDGKPAKA